MGIKFSRREFFKAAAVITIGLAAGATAVTRRFLLKENRFKGTAKKYAVCPFCGLGCGMTIYVKGKKVISVQGDKDNPVNTGSLCKKGLSAVQLINSQSRLDSVKYRRPNSTEWETISYQEAVEKIARRIKDARDKTFISDENGNKSSRTDGILSVCGNDLTNEEAYLFNKFSRILGVADTGNDALFLKEKNYNALSGTFGISALPNPWVDISNSDLIVIMGSDIAETSPMIMKHVISAKNKGAKIVTIDPRFTQTASISDHFVQINPSSDAVLINGLINYLIRNNLLNTKFIKEYTDAPYLVNDFYNYDSKSGVFSGYDAKKQEYSETYSWEYDLDERGNPGHDPEMTNPKSVLVKIKEFMEQYDPFYVQEETSYAGENLVQIADLFAETCGEKKAASIIIGSGVSSGYSGASAVRAAVMLQLLSGNIGKAGGGIYFTSKAANEQGSMDQIPGWNMLPGNLSLADLSNHEGEYKFYLQNNSFHSVDSKSVNLYKNFMLYYEALISAWFKDGAPSPKNIFPFMPKIQSESSSEYVVSKLTTGKYKGGLFFGGDLVNSGINKQAAADGFKTMEWIVCTGPFMNDTSEFWKENPAAVATEVFMMPTDLPIEKKGSFTAGDRTIQWCEGIYPGKNRDEASILISIFKEIKSLYSTGFGALPEVIDLAKFGYGADYQKEIHKEICGIDKKTKSYTKGIESFNEETEVSCGNWLYSGGIDSDGNFLSARRSNEKVGKNVFVNSEWGFAWPNDIRYLYNRAGISRDGKSFNREKFVLDSELGQNDSFLEGDLTPNKNPFYFNREGTAYLFAKKIKNGPLPVGYRIPSQQNLSDIFIPLKNFALAVVNDGLVDSKLVLMPWLIEQCPSDFCEISEETAKFMGISDRSKLLIDSGKFKMEFPVVVSGRIKDLKLKYIKTPTVYLNGNKGRFFMENDQNIQRMAKITVIKGS